MCVCKYVSYFLWCAISVFDNFLEFSQMTPFHAISFRLFIEIFNEYIHCIIGFLMISFKTHSLLSESSLCSDSISITCGWDHRWKQDSVDYIRSILELFRCLFLPTNQCLKLDAIFPFDNSSFKWLSSISVSSRVIIL